ncbi:hypothetical protein QNI16_36145 [Cytophagaceae bacterium YF14B1]|uniref:Uncharacterized protein n=1 Tax=Xanthocytophaga flava TaxID=3048013 RepID=A0AAE3UAB2_9BACT|nr:hypothetical protein [Xanthocytophaga flavus]MDJ1485969.1 hypothetical protein [Xanthocytophaga flavus]
MSVHIISVHTGEQLTRGIDPAGEKRVGPGLTLQTLSAEHPSWMEYTIGVYREIFTLKDLDCTFGLLFALWMAMGLYKWLYKWLEIKRIYSRTDCF